MVATCGKSPPCAHTHKSRYGDTRRNFGNRLTKINASGNPSLSPTQAVSATVFHSLLFEFDLTVVCFLCVSLNGRRSSNFGRKQKTSRTGVEGTNQQQRRKGACKFLAAAAAVRPPSAQCCVFLVSGMALDTLVFEEPRQRRELLYNNNTHTHDAPAFCHSKGLFGGKFEKCQCCFPQCF